MTAAAITTAKQGFGTWITTGNTPSDSWSGNTDTLSAVITGCKAALLGGTTTYFTVVASPPSNGQHVDFADFLAISGQCNVYCATQASIAACFNHFFTFD